MIGLAISPSPVQKYIHGLVFLVAGVLPSNAGHREMSGTTKSPRNNNTTNSDGRQVCLSVVLDAEV